MLAGFGCASLTCANVNQRDLFTFAASIDDLRNQHRMPLSRVIVSGFIPSTLHEIAEFTPSLTEWKISAGIWAVGLMILTRLLKLTITVLNRTKTVQDRETARLSK